jgi:hypothetical protein
MVFYFRFICAEELGKAKFICKKYYEVSFYEKQNENSSNTYKNTFHFISSEASIPTYEKKIYMLLLSDQPLEELFSIR